MAKKKDQTKQQNMQLKQSGGKYKDIRKEKKAKGWKPVLLIFVLVVLVVLMAAALWKLSGEGSVPSEKQVFTVGEEEVYLDEVNFCILQYVMNLGLDSESLENSASADGGSTEEEYKQAILEFIMDYHVENQAAEKQGIELTKEEEKNARNDAVSFMGKINGSVANKLGITQECVNEVYRKLYLADKLEESVTNDVTVESQNYCTMYLLFFPKVKMTENGDYEKQEDGKTPVMLSEEEISRRRKDADAAYQELKDGADIEEVAEKYGVETYSGEESNLVESFGEPFSGYAASLKENEFSPVIETESCYAILKMITVNNQEVSDQIMGYYQADMEKEKITEMKSQWYEDVGAGRTPEFKGNVWKNISLYDYTQYVEE